MFEEKRARETLYGYINMSFSRADTFLLPNPYLLVLLQKKSGRGMELVQELKLEVEDVCVEIRRQDTTPFNKEIIDKIVEYTISQIKPEFLEEVNGNIDQIEKAASLGLRLGKRDPNRTGDRPPWVRRIEYEAVDKFFPDGKSVTSWACSTAVHNGLYTSRVGWA